MRIQGFIGYRIQDPLAVRLKRKTCASDMRPAKRLRVKSAPNIVTVIVRGNKRKLE